MLLFSNVHPRLVQLGEKSSGWTLLSRMATHVGLVHPDKCEFDWFRSLYTSVPSLPFPDFSWGKGRGLILSGYRLPRLHSYVHREKCKFHLSFTSLPSPFQIFLGGGRGSDFCRLFVAKTAVCFSGCFPHSYLECMEILLKTCLTLCGVLGCISDVLLSSCFRL